MAPRYQKLSDFYWYYLTEHRNPICRGLHLFGTFLVILMLVVIPFTGRLVWLWLLPVVGYGFAWIGHAFFEKNKPATFQYPLFSLASDFIMLWDFLTGKLTAKLSQAPQKVEEFRTTNLS
ncbi:MAG: DUF962 domain-containing protein [Bacteroidia bacterium]|nr:DUF962 domain-containing protein [Bacteroidia bacterium]MDW8158397.1 DUF962 domain-containing protein [Bacteroidia bacterium]